MNPAALQPEELEALRGRLESAVRGLTRRPYLEVKMAVEEEATRTNGREIFINPGTAAPEAGEAEHGFLRRVAALLLHETGHVFFTPFSGFARGDVRFPKLKHWLLNMLEDRRVESLMAMQFPLAEEYIGLLNSALARQSAATHRDLSEKAQGFEIHPVSKILTAWFRRMVYGFVTRGLDRQERSVYKQGVPFLVPPWYVCPFSEIEERAGKLYGLLEPLMDEKDDERIPIVLVRNFSGQPEEPVKSPSDSRSIPAPKGALKVRRALKPGPGNGNQASQSSPEGAKQPVQAGPEAPEDPQKPGEDGAGGDNGNEKQDEGAQDNQGGETGAEPEGATLAPEPGDSGFEEDQGGPDPSGQAKEESEGGQSAEGLVDLESTADGAMPGEPVAASDAGGNSCAPIDLSSFREPGASLLPARVEGLAHSARLAGVRNAVVERTEGSPSEYRRLRARLAGTTEALKRELEDILCFGESFEAGLKSGLLDRRRLPLAPASAEVFKRRTTWRTAGETAVVILLDQSGSMTSIMHWVRDAAIIFHEALRGLDITHAILGHTYSEGRVRLLEHYLPAQASSAFRLATLNSYWGNRDGDAIRASTPYLRSLPQDFKLLLVINDGLPSEYGSTEEGVEDTRRAAFQAGQDARVVGLWLGSDRPPEQFITIYPDHVAVPDPKDLPRAMARQLAGIVGKAMASS